MVVSTIISGPFAVVAESRLLTDISAANCPRRDGRPINLPFRAGEALRPRRYRAPPPTQRSKEEYDAACKRCPTDCDPKKLLLDMAYRGGELDPHWRERQN
jgi:hypothetical protein